MYMKLAYERVLKKLVSKNDIREISSSFDYQNIWAFHHSCIKKMTESVKNKSKYFEVASQTLPWREVIFHMGTQTDLPIPRKGITHRPQRSSLHEAFDNPVDYVVLRRCPIESLQCNYS